MTWLLLKSHRRHLWLLYPHSPGHLEREDSSHPRRRQAEVSSQASSQLCPQSSACLSSIMKVLVAAVFVLCAVALCSCAQSRSAICSPLSVATHTVVRSPAHMLWLKNLRVKLENIEWDFKNDMVPFFKKLQKECIDLGCRLELREVLSYFLGEKLEV